MEGHDGRSGQVPSLRRHNLPTVEGAAHRRVPGLRPVVFNRAGTAATGADREPEAAEIGGRRLCAVAHHAREGGWRCWPCSATIAVVSFEVLPGPAPAGLFFEPPPGFPSAAGRASIALQRSGGVKDVIPGRDRRPERSFPFGRQTARCRRRLRGCLYGGRSPSGSWH